jgi:hypothetical protein
MVHVIGGLGKSKAVHIDENYQKPNKKETSVSESKTQEKIYNISHHDNRQRSRNTYVPFNSLTFSDGTVTVPGFTTENIVESSTGWWKKSKKKNQQQSQTGRKQLQSQQLQKHLQHLSKRSNLTQKLVIPHLQTVPCKRMSKKKVKPTY